MNKLGPFALAAQFAPRLFQVRRRTWIVLSVGVLFLFGLFIWAAVALLGWLFGQAQNWMVGAPETVRGAIEQAEQALPDVREKIGAWVPDLKPSEPRRDVFGSDLGPVARYPGMARSYWHREDAKITIEYEGKVDYAAVIDHYAEGFAAEGYAQNVQSAMPTAETHAYTKGSERIVLTVAQLPTKGVVSARLEFQQITTAPYKI